jgi:hypothetical protein
MSSRCRSYFFNLYTLRTEKAMRPSGAYENAVTSSSIVLTGLSRFCGRQVKVQAKAENKSSAANLGKTAGTAEQAFGFLALLPRGTRKIPFIPKVMVSDAAPCSWSNRAFLWARIPLLQPGYGPGRKHSAPFCRRGRLPGRQMFSGHSLAAARRRYPR